MKDTPSICQLDGLKLSFEPKAWPFATERRAEINAYFEGLRREKLALWNGRVLMLHHQVVEKTCSTVNTWKPTMQALPPGAIGAGRPQACGIVSARRQC
ncbi:MAG TPA: hypothetical protein VKE53_00705 [Pseudolabrys sp.]|nr:hypothetical protein [Pseudolabrys sp.]